MSLDALKRLLGDILGKKAIAFRQLGNGDIELTIECVQCRNDFKVTVKDKDLQRYVEGQDYIQTCFPYLRAADRELIQSQVCGECFDEMFADDDDGDEI